MLPIWPCIESDTLRLSAALALSAFQGFEADDLLEMINIINALLSSTILGT